MSEASFYNALNIFYQGDYSKLNHALEKSGSWQKAWKQAGGDSGLDVDEAWRKLSDQGIHLSLQPDADFPALLKEIPWPPLAIYWKGAPLIKDQRMVAIVGTRKATFNGLAIAKKFASAIALAGVPVASGLALGIDSSVHEGVLEGNGKTIAVLANGLDCIYPAGNENLAKKILANGGTLVSEYASGKPAYPSRFIERNRIISGLSSGVVIVEAPADSGALATARFAVEQNREVFVVPGAVGQSNYEGSNNLIKTGAFLVTVPEEVLIALNIAVASPVFSGDSVSAKNLDLLDENQKAIIKILKNYGEPLSIDKIQELTRMEIPLINRAVSLLEIQDIIKEEYGNYHLTI